MTRISYQERCDRHRRGRRYQRRRHFLRDGIPLLREGATHRGPYKDGPGEINVPITVGGAIVRPGDVVFGDADGVVVVPLEEAEELAEKVGKIVEKEAVMMREIDEGTTDRSWIDRTLEQRGCQWIGFEARDSGGQEWITAARLATSCRRRSSSRWASPNTSPSASRDAAAAESSSSSTPASLMPAWPTRSSAP